MADYITDWKHNPDEIMDKEDLKETRRARTFSDNAVVELNIAKAYQRNILENDEQLILIVFGQAGTGKSTLTMWLE